MNSTTDPRTARKDIETGERSRAEHDRRVGGIPAELNCEVLYTTSWLQLLSLTDPEQGVYGYVCTHEKWIDGHAVAVLPYRINSRWMLGRKMSGGRCEYLLRREITPCWGMRPSLSSITGGMDKEGESALGCAMRELHEEGGYVVGPDKQHLWVDLGIRRMSKASTTVMHLFAVNLTGQTKVEAPGDGSELEAKGSCEWRTDPENAQDVLVGCMAFALQKAIA